MAFTIALVGMFATNTAEAAKRKVVIEDHTGAWCGYCPRGTQTIEGLEASYGEKLIGVAVHNTSNGRPDNMAIPTYQNPLGTMIGLTGFPTGSVNRIPYGGAIAMSDGAWAGRAAALVDQDVPVGVKLVVNYNKATGDYTATITATVEAGNNAPLAFNLWILQDYMIGAGSGWDQANYFSGSDKSSQYYDDPNPIPNFYHNNVFRFAHGGVEGEQGTFPAGNVPAGTYTQVYTGNVSSKNVTDKNNAIFVAVVHNTATKEIVNADSFGKLVKPKDKLATAVAAPYVTIVDDTKHKGEITLTNDEDWSVTADLTIDADKSLLPAGWGISLSNNSVTLKSKETRKIQIEVLKNKIEAFGQIVVKVTPQASSDHLAVNSDATVYFMSENIEDAIIYGFDDGIAPIINAVNTSGELNKPVPVSGATEIIANFPQMTNFKIAVFTVSDASIGFSDANTASQLGLIKSLMNKGCDILIASCFDLLNSAAITNSTPTPQATDFYTNTLGVTLGSPLQILNQQGQLSAIPFAGVSGDPIGGGISFNYNTAYNSQTYPYYAQYMGTMQLNGKSGAVAFLSASTAVSPTTLNENNNKVGIRIDNNGQRTVYYSFALDPAPNPGRDLLIKNSLNWLKGAGTTVKGPSISLSTTQVVFGEIKQDKTGSETIKISNTGDQPLVISAMNFKTGTNFKVKGSGSLTIDAGQTVNISVEFTPTEVQNYSDEITIVSNDKANPESIVSLKGIGTSAGTTSVTGIIPNVFTMTVGPNPVVNNSEINLTINGSVNLDLQLIDATGKVVRTVYSGVTTSNTLELNAAQLSSGTYYLNANVNGKTTQLPIVVTK